MIGPDIPKELLEKKRQNEAEIEVSLSDEELDVPAGPLIPAHLLKQRQANAMADQDVMGPSTPLPKTAGPEIPAHLLEEKRNNVDEIAISDGDDNMAGPAIPPHILEKRKQQKEEEKEEVDPDEFAPALPPDLLAQRQQQQVTEPQAGKRRRRPVGPSFPTGPLPSEQDNNDIVGPSLPTNYDPEQESKYSAIQAIEERAQTKSDKVERPEWMIMPPEIDYLKAAQSGKSRQFSNRTMTDTERDNTGWVETPAERERRLQEEQKSGGKRKAVEQDPAVIRAEIEMRRNVQEYNMQTRPMTLLEMHKQNRKKAKNLSAVEDVTKRAFDREKDLLGGKRLDKKQKNQLFQSSSDLGSKFGYGKSSFL
ncbi:hypothetical protein CU098_009015 [Rhizopus stolonifer]|uniref:DUF3752 domain-containing protein n=1 Tax=Rhizopus stolonifer TaxID=4846 RepID=A0A367JS24_RHIST|nr:hypothetical protein CU098_009015 [Rhizopus stolonifer]